MPVEPTEIYLLNRERKAQAFHKVKTQVLRIWIILDNISINSGAHWQVYYNLISQVLLSIYNLSS